MATPTSLRRRHQSSTEIETPPSQRRKIDRIYGRPRRFDDLPTCPLSHTSQSQGARPGWGNNRGNTVRCRTWAQVKTYSLRWSLQPVLRSEDHPVFIQPVKEHIIRRSKALGSWASSVSSTARSDKNSVRRRRKRDRISDHSSTESSLSTSGPNTESSINDAGPVGPSAPNTEVVDVDVTAGYQNQTRHSPIFLTTRPSTAHSSGPIANPQSSALSADDPAGTLVDDDALSYFARNDTTNLPTPSSTEQVYGRMAPCSSSTGTTLFSTLLVARAPPASDILPSEDTGSFSSALSSM